MMNSPYVTQVVISLLLLTASPVFGQVLMGEVLDNDGQALPSAQVLLRAQGAVRGFAMTDAEGLFSLELEGAPKESVVEIRFFGYGTWARTLSKLDANRMLEVVLHQEGVALKEVVVAAGALPRVNKGDTIVHRTDTYRDGSERKIEEVIAKLPDVEVDAEGKITVKGKALDRILVDGEDMFDKNYRLLSRNVPADFVDQIDILTNYQQDQLVGNLAGKSEIVLDLHLDATKKRPLFGEATAQLGNRRTRALNANLFHLGKRLKTVNFSDYGTLGHESGVGVDLLYRSQGLNGRAPESARPILRSEATRQYRLVREQDYLNNEALGTAQTLLYRINDNTKNRLIFNLSGEAYNLSEDRLREALTETRADSFAQRNEYRYRTRRFWALNDFDILLDKKSRIDVRVGVTGAFNSAGVETQNSRVRTGERDTLQTDLEGQPLSLLLSSRYVRRLAPGTALRISGSWQHERYGQRQNYQGEVYRNLPGQIGAGDPQQVMDQRLTTANAQVDLLRQINKGNLTLTLGYRDNESMTSTALQTSAGPTISPTNQPYRLREAYLRTATHYSQGKLTADLSLTASYFQLPVPTNSENGIRPRLTTLQPGFNLDYAFSRRTKFSVWGREKRKAPRPDQLITTPYLAGNNSLSVGLDSGYLERTYELGVKYSYENKFDQYGYSGSLRFHRTPNGVGNAVVVDNFVIFDQLIPGLPTEMLTANLSVFKYVAKLKTNFKIVFRHTRMENILFLGAERLPSVTGAYGLALHTTTRFDKSLRYGLKVNYDDFRTSIGATDSQQGQVFAEHRLTARFGKQMNAEVKHRAYFPRLNTGAETVHLVEAKCGYDLKQKQLRFVVGVRNLLNRSGITERNISVYQRFTRSYELRPLTFYGEVTKTF